jgi:hypothetical protein
VITMPNVLTQIAAIFKPKPSPPPVQVQILYRDVCRLTLDEWRSDAALTKAAAKFLNDPQFRVMVDVLRTQHLANSSLPTDAPPEARSAWLGRIEGYGAALTDLESMMVFAKPVPQLEATFEPETLEKETA